MSQSKTAAKVALMGLTTLAATQIATEAFAAPKMIKCYGVAAAGKNNCGTVVSACDGTIKEAKACYAWKYETAANCNKLMKLKDKDGKLEYPQASALKPIPSSAENGCLGPQGQKFK